MGHSLTPDLGIALTGVDDGEGVGGRPIAAYFEYGTATSSGQSALRQ